MSKKVPFIILFVILFSGAIYYLNIYKSQYKIVGVLNSVNETSMIVYGRYDSAKKDELKKITLEIPKDVKIIRTFFILPPRTDDNKPFIADKLPQEVSEVNIDSLIKDEKNITIGVEVTLEKNWLSFSPVAKEIKYTGPKY